MWAAMAKQLNWERRRFDGKPTINIKEESEFRKGDFASRWIAKTEKESPHRLMVGTLLEKHIEMLDRGEIDFLTNLLGYTRPYSPKQIEWLTRIAGKAKLCPPREESVKTRKSKKRGPITTPRRSSWQGKKLAPGEPPF
jgi:hypothetical protein